MEQVRAQNDEIRKQREDFASGIATKFAQFKKDFLGAPFRRAFKGLAAKNGNTQHSCEISYRQDESYFVSVAPSEVTVSFGLNFENKEDKALAKVFLQEFVDSRRHVKQPPAVLYHE